MSNPRPRTFLPPTVFALAGLALTSALALWPVLVRSGWPFNHEKLSFAIRTRIFAQHLEMGDLIPLWSSMDSFGFGSPLPILYHKLFYYLSATGFLTTGSMKVSVVGTLFLLLVAGGTGLFLTARRLGASTTLSLSVSILFLLANYTTTNWLVRGALAEFSATMLIPWAFLWCVTLIRERRWGLWIAPLLFLMLLAHSVITYVMVLIVLLPAAAFLLPNARTSSDLHNAVRPALVSIAIFGVAALPFLLAGLHMAEHFDITRVIERGFSPATQMVPLSFYLADSRWTWGALWDFTPVEMDRLLLLPAAGLLLTMVILGRHGAVSTAIGRTTLFLLLVFVLVFLFLTPVALPLYEAIPGLTFLQFPWRMLALATPVLALLIADLAARIEAVGHARPIRVLALAVTAGAFLSYGGFREIQYDWFSEAELEAPLPASFSLTGVGEYFPRVPEPDIEVTFRKIKAWAANGGSDGPCHVAEPDAVQQEVLERTFLVDCPTHAEVRLPLFFSGAETLSLLDPNGRQVPVPHRRTEEDPRVTIALQPGQHRVHIALPTLKRLFWR